MAKVFGEAFLDARNGKYYYSLSIVPDEGGGELLHESDHVFATKSDAEAQLVEILRGLKKMSGA